jgi:hypothetical protein
VCHQLFVSVPSDVFGAHGAQLKVRFVGLDQADEPPAEQQMPSCHGREEI